MIEISNTMVQIFDDFKKLISENDFMKTFLSAGIICLLSLVVYHLGEEFGAIIAQLLK